MFEMTYNMIDKLSNSSAMLAIAVLTIVFVIFKYHKIKECLVNIFEHNEKEYGLVKNDDRKYLLVLLLFMIIAWFLRVPFLSIIPNGFTHDEASRGYDAYSILLTQRDRHGAFMPLFLKAFGEYPSSLYVFMVIPAILLFGLTETAVRFPAALLGFLTVFVMYFLVKEIFNRKIALLASILLAVSSWHIQFSRVSFDATPMIFFFSVGLLLFFKSIRGDGKYAYLSALFFILCCHSYFAARVFVPLFLCVLVFIYRHELWRNKKHALTAMFLFLLFFAALTIFWVTKEGMSRASGLLFIKWPDTVSRYLSYFNPDFLFLTGDKMIRHTVRGMGILYIYEIIPILVSLIMIFSHLKHKVCQLFLAWLILYPIPASLTYHMSPHALRSILGIPLFIMLSSLGIYLIVSAIHNKSLRYSIAIFVIAIITVFSLRFSHIYFLEYPQSGSWSWFTGFREAYKFVDDYASDCVVISDSMRGGKIFMLFYTRFPPQKCQENLLSRNTSNLQWGKYQFEKIKKDTAFNTDCIYMMESKKVGQVPKNKYHIGILKKIELLDRKNKISILNISHK